jgi:hypothetical protein
VYQTCNPSYLGGEDQEDHSSRSAPAKLVRLHLNQWAVHGGTNVIPAIPGSIIGGSTVQAGLRDKARLYLKNSQHKKWQNGSSGKEAAWQG